MSKLKYILSVATVICMMTTLVGCAKTDMSDSDKLIITAPFEGGEADILRPEAREYLEAKSASEQARILVEQAGVLLDDQYLSIGWESDGGHEYDLYLADNESLENAKAFHTRFQTEVNVGGTLIPGKTYYYKIAGKNRESAIDSFKVKDVPLRTIRADGAHNVRDLGGWKTDDGQIAYGKIFRGGKINNGQTTSLTQSGIDVMVGQLGIKTEIDLRFKNADDGGQKESVLGANVNYLKAGFNAYSCILPEFENYGDFNRKYYVGATAVIKNIFTTLADESKYPIYFHCNAGADRTGTLALLIEAVAGVSESDIIKDYEFTSFSIYGARYRGKIENGKFVNGVMQDNTENFVAFGLFMDDLKRFYGGGSNDLRISAENYLKQACGVTQDEIDSVKRILIK